MTPDASDRPTDRHRTTRRGALAAGAAGVGALAVAGCTGRETARLVLTTATETSAAYAMSQGIAAVVNEHADGVRIDARPSEGTRANVGRLDRGESDIAYLQNWTARKVRRGDPPFDGLSYAPRQLFHLYDLGWFFCTARDGWRTVSDVEPGSRVSPTPRGSGTAGMLTHALDRALDDYERVSVDYGAQAGAMNEGRLDVGAGTLVNFGVEPGWLEQMKSTVDLGVLGWSDAAGIRDDGALLVTDVAMDAFDGYARAPDTLPALTLAYNFVVRDDAPREPLRELLDALYAGRDALRDRHALLGALEDGTFWTKNAFEIAFHSAAAAFYRDRGLWRDGLESG
jgi:TRAP transporter TAXI family solute receptor